MSKVIEPFDIIETALNPGRCLIEASAGTGKTYAISNIFLRLILEKGLHPSNILVVTFTVAATAELRDRLRLNLKEAFKYIDSPKSEIDLNVKKIVDGILKQKTKDEIKKILQLSLLEFDEAAIFTIHGFCQRMLAENAFESGSMFGVELIKNQDELIAEVVEDCWRKYFYGSSVLSGIIKSSGITLSELKKSAAYIAENSEITFLPENPDLKSIEKLSSKITEAVESVIAVWRKTKDKIEQEFETLSINLLKAKRELLTSVIANFKNAVELNLDYTEDIYLVKELEKEAVIEGFKKGKQCEFGSAFEGFSDLCTKLNDAFEEFKLQFECMLFLNFREGRDLKAKKKELSVVTFSDMLTEMRDGLMINGELNPENPLAKKIRKQYKAALIDEFQDTDNVQYEIFNTIFNNSESIMFMIGDPKQSIYRFRGADIFAYLKVKTDEDVKEYTLDTNYRTVEPLVKAVDQWFQNSTSPNSFVYSKLSYNGVKASPRNRYNCIDNADSPLSQNPFFMFCASSRNKGSAVKAVSMHTAVKIAEILNDSEKSKVNILKSDSIGAVKEKKKITPSDIAVLVRTNEQAANVKKALSKVSVPSVIQSTGNIFKTDEAYDILRLLDAVASKSDSKKIKTLLAGKLIGLTPDQIYSLETNENSSEFEYWLDIFAGYNRRWIEKSFISMFLAFLEPEDDIEYELLNSNCSSENLKRNRLAYRKDVRTNVLKYEGGERALTNILHLAELIHEEEAKNKLGPDAVIQWLYKKITSDNKAAEQEEHEIRLDTDEEAVKIKTIHASKGLEYPIVFCPFLWAKTIKTQKTSNISNSTFHKDDGLYYDLYAPESHQNEVEIENLAEEIRLIYVAMTRAVYRLYIHFVDITTGYSKQTPLYYLMNAMVNGNLEISENEKISSVLKETSVNLDNLNLLNCTIDRDFLKSAELEINYKPPVKEGGLDKKYSEVKLLYPEKIVRNWGVMSYSSLVQSSHSRGVVSDRDFDDDRKSANTYESEEEILQKKLGEHPETSFFHFPRMGRFTGSFCHDILEKFDFASLANPDWKTEQSLKILIETKLKSYGLIKTDEEGYNATLDLRFEQVYDMLEKVLSTPLSDVDENFSLKMLDEENRAPEMEFYYPAGKLADEKKLNSIFNKYSFIELRKNKKLNKILQNAGIKFNNIYGKRQGFITGSIDLTFVYNGKFYIGDWKASWLGPECNDYSTEALLNNMAESGYFLQHNLYAFALHKFIKTKVKNYAQNTEKYFNDYFGGVFYFYIRGMNGSSPELGYIFDKPDYKLLKHFSALL